MPTTVPNQRVVQIHREPAKTNFLGIKNETWQAAARDLGAHACLLYLYLASPYNYETRAAYNEALKAAKGGFTQSPDASCAEQPTSQAAVDDGQQYIYCRVSRLDNGANEYYLSETNEIKVGDSVQVPTENGTASGIVIAVELHTASMAPQPPEKTPWIER